MPSRLGTQLRLALCFSLATMDQQPQQPHEDAVLEDADDGEEQEEPDVNALNWQEGVIPTPESVTDQSETTPADTVPQHECVAPPSALLIRWLAEVAEHRSRGYVPPQPDPDECFLMNRWDFTEAVFTYLKERDLSRCAMVCKAFREASEASDLWARLYSFSRRLPATVPCEYLSSWKECFRRARNFPNIADWKTHAEKYRSKDALLLPSGTYSPLLIGVDSLDQLTIVGVTGPHGEPVVIESSATVISNTCELLSSNIVLRNLTLRSLVEDVPPNHWCPSVIYARGKNILLENCELTARCNRVYGLSAEPTASIEMRSCHVHSMPNVCIILWKDASVLMKDCRVMDSGPIVLRQTSEINFVDCTISGRPKYEAELLSALQDTKVTATNCKFIGGGDRSSGLNVYGDLTMQKVEITGPFFSITKRDKGVVKLKECRITSPRDGGNHFQICDPCDVLLDTCELRGATSSVEMEDHAESESRTKLAIDSCKFISNECAVLLGDKCDTSITNCTFESNGTGIRLEELGANIARNTFASSGLFGIYLQCVGAPASSVERTWRNTNTFRRNRNDIFIDDVTIPIPAGVGGTDRDKLDRTILISMVRKVCTYQLTGPHYKKQRVYRCLTCKLVDYRGMCCTCAAVCHVGHEILTEDIQMFYCDCGAEKFCETLQKAQEKHRGAEN